KIWHLVQTMVGENSTAQHNVSRKMSLVIGARHHLEWGHEKYIMDTVQSHPTQAALGGAVGNLQRIRAFLRICLRDYEVLDFDAGDTRRQPPVDTTWQQLTEWINSGGVVPADIAASASEECEKMLRMGDRVGRAAYDKKKLLLYAIISGSRRQIDPQLRDLPTLFTTIEDFLWFKLSAIRDTSSGTSSAVLSDGLVPYSLAHLQAYLNKFEPSYYTKNGKDPLVYPYVLLFMSIQLLTAVQHLAKEVSHEGYDAYGVLSEAAGAGQKLGVMDAHAEVSSLIRQFGSAFLRYDNLSMALEYYAQAAAAVGGGERSWTETGNVDQQRERNLMLKQLLMELLLRDGGIQILLGPRGSGEEGELLRPLGMMFSHHERDRVLEQETVLRQLEAILSVRKLARLGQHLDALREIRECLMSPLMIDFRIYPLMSSLQGCGSDLLKVTLTCLDNVTDTDGTIRAIRAK
ncbi:hypothetical protein Tsubulata_050953, partial [Turnera subulata]